VVKKGQNLINVVCEQTLIRWDELSPDTLWVRLRTLNLRKRGLNPDKGSICSFDEDSFNLSLSKNPADPRLSRKQHNKLPTDSYKRQFPVLCFIVWCAVVSREKLVKHYDDISSPYQQQYQNPSKITVEDFTLTTKDPSF
jgi:hypothetical protein